MERLQKVIANAGICSRRKAEELILNNKVTVNGHTINELGYKVLGDETIKVNNKIIKKENKVYYLINKPKNVLSTTSDDRERKTIVDYIDTDKRIYPVGRLDFDSTGLLILTNDGNFTNQLIHPKYHLPKMYDVTINGLLDINTLKELEQGIVLEDGKTAPCKIKIKHKDEEKKITVFDITLWEGKNRQIRRMFEHYNFKVTKLHRFQFGGLRLGNMNAGSYRKLTSEEVTSLLELSRIKNALN